MSVILTQRGRGRRPTRWRAWVVVALGTLGMVACSPTLDWRDTSFPDAPGLAAQFPCKPDRFTRTLPLAGHPVALSLSSCQAGGVTFALAHADLGDPTAVAPALTELRAAFARNLGGEPRVIADATVPGATPNPQTQRVAVDARAATGPALHAQALFFVRGTRVHQATVLGSGPELDGVDTFLDSIRMGN